jgi:hypothetical protein
VPPVQTTPDDADWRSLIPAAVADRFAMALGEAAPGVDGPTNWHLPAELTPGREDNETGQKIRRVFVESLVLDHPRLTQNQVQEILVATFGIGLEGSWIGEQVKVAREAADLPYRRRTAKAQTLAADDPDEPRIITYLKADEPTLLHSKASALRADIQVLLDVGAPADSIAVWRPVPARVRKVVTVTHEIEID